ncbi:UNVERIFIED_CONTAM: hypothetical protein K2H54_045713 [Gekko kuhli]
MLFRHPAPEDLLLTDASLWYWGAQCETLTEPEASGHQHSGAAEATAEEPNRGVAKRPVAEAPEERNGAAAPKRTKKSTCTLKEPGATALTVGERKGRKQKDGNGQYGKNPQKNAPTLQATVGPRAPGTF